MQSICIIIIGQYFNPGFSNLQHHLHEVPCKELGSQSRSWPYFYNSQRHRGSRLCSSDYVLDIFIVSLQKKERKSTLCSGKKVASQGTQPHCSSTATRYLRDWQTSNSSLPQPFFFSLRARKLSLPVIIFKALSMWVPFLLLV